MDFINLKKNSGIKKSKNYHRIHGLKNNNSGMLKNLIFFNFFSILMVFLPFFVF